MRIGSSPNRSSRSTQFLNNTLVDQINLSSNRGIAGSILFPTVFDAIRTAKGITPFSDLSSVQVTRKRAEGLGGGRIRTNLNFLKLMTEGDSSQNISYSTVM